MTAPRQGRWIALVVALLLAVAVLFVVPAKHGIAVPGSPSGDEGSASLLKQVEAASRGFLEAKAALEASKNRQRELTDKLTNIESREVPLAATVAGLADVAYRYGGDLQTASALLNSDSPTGFLDKLTTLSVIGSHNARQLSELVEVRTDLAQAKAAIDAEVVNQEKQLAEMAKRKEAAERALASAGGGQATSGPGGSSTRVAVPAPRRADGSWPPESCRLRDPTTSGCITPRTLHALQQAKAAGFNRYVACFRPGGSGEHPKGRACDWSASPSGFLDRVATGGDREYGNNIAAFFIANANRLAVLYVIWFKQIWLPSSGWRAYRSGRGDPASDHTNHCHLSVY
jgi:peptidoglycan DL-endopeptidase CwlO